MDNVIMFDEIATEDMEFPVKDKKRAKRIKKDFAKGKRRQDLEYRIIGNDDVPAEYANKHTNRVNKSKSKHSRSKGNIALKSKRDVLGNHEMWAKASDRRNTEAMEQRMKLYNSGSDPDDDILSQDYFLAGHDLYGSLDADKVAYETVYSA